MTEIERQKSHFEISKLVRDSSFSMKDTHSHSFYEIFFLINGTCLLQIGKEHYTLKAGNLAIISPNTPHRTSYANTATAERVSLEFSENYLNWLCKNWGEHWILEKLKSNVFEPAESESRNIEFILNNINAETKKDELFKNEFIELLFSELMLYIIRCNRYSLINDTPKITYNRNIELAIDYINANFKRKISLEEVANMLHLNPSYFSKQFKTVNGVGFSEYIANLRIVQSEKLLLETNKSITEIAFECGFENSNYYGDVFKKLNHVSPSEFRRLKGSV